MSNKLYCPKCFAAVEVGEDGYLMRHYRAIASGEHRKCHGKRGTKDRPSAITVVSGGLPNSRRRR